MISGGFFSSAVCARMISRSLSSDVLRHVVARHVARRQRGHLHGEVARERGVAALDLDEHADARAVQVAADGGAALDDVETPHGDVLADLRHELEPQLFDGSAVDGSCAAAPRRSPGVGVSTTSASLSTNARKLSSLATKSVSELTSSTTWRPDCSSLRIATRPSAATRDGLLVGLRRTGLAQPARPRDRCRPGFRPAPSCIPSCRRRCARAVP